MLRQLMHRMVWVSSSSWADILVSLLEMLLLQMEKLIFALYPNYPLNFMVKMGFMSLYLPESRIKVTVWLSLLRVQKRA